MNHTADPHFLSALERHLHAVANRNIDDFAATVSRRVRLAGTDGGLITGEENAVEAHRAWFAEPGWQFDVAERIETESCGDVGWALVRVHYRTAATTTAFNLFLLFVREADSQWRLRYDQGTNVS